jgi:hypothetical protein
MGSRSFSTFAIHCATTCSRLSVYFLTPDADRPRVVHAAGAGGPRDEGGGVGERAGAGKPATRLYERADRLDLAAPWGPAPMASR